MTPQWERVIVGRGVRAGGASSVEHSAGIRQQFAARSRSNTASGTGKQNAMKPRRVRLHRVQRPAKRAAALARSCAIRPAATATHASAGVRTNALSEAALSGENANTAQIAMKPHTIHKHKSGTEPDTSCGYVAGVEIYKGFAKLNPHNCAVKERTGDGVPVGPCCFYLADGTTCPTHGRVKLFPTCRECDGSGREPEEAKS